MQPLASARDALRFFSIRYWLMRRCSLVYLLLNYCRRRRIRSFLERMERVLSSFHPDACLLRPFMLPFWCWAPSLSSASPQFTAIRHTLAKDAPVAQCLFLTDAFSPPTPHRFRFPAPFLFVPPRTLSRRRPAAPSRLDRINYRGNGAMAGLGRNLAYCNAWLGVCHACCVSCLVCFYPRARRENLLLDTTRPGYIVWETRAVAGEGCMLRTWWGP